MSRADRSLMSPAVPRMQDVFAYCPRCGERSGSQGARPFECAGCSFRFFFGPVAAVAAILEDSSGRLLFLERARDPGKGLLGLPGGFADPGETLEEAVARELLEETGLKVSLLNYFCSIPNGYIYQQIEISVLDVFYVGRVDTLEGIQMQASEIASTLIEHPSPQLLDRMAFASNRRAVERFMAYRTEWMGESRGKVRGTGDGG
ncbi:MAG: NUDIX hydrolase [Pirellulaceae bacterium]